MASRTRKEDYQTLVKYLPDDQPLTLRCGRTRVQVTSGVATASGLGESAVTPDCVLYVTTAQLNLIPVK